jgi:D-arabinose 1-dehydrogenase-like Zn-dependent alcohol dehydrogenase
MDVHPGDLVAVQGIGGLGHLGIQFAAKMGYRVVALSSSPSKAALAKELGAHEYIDGSSVDQGEALQKLGGAKVIMCTAPRGDVINKLYGGMRPKGTILILASALYLPLSTLTRY